MVIKKGSSKYHNIQFFVLVVLLIFYLQYVRYNLLKFIYESRTSRLTDMIKYRFGRYVADQVFRAAVDIEFYLDSICLYLYLIFGPIKQYFK